MIIKFFWTISSQKTLDPAALNTFWGLCLKDPLSYISSLQLFADLHRSSMLKLWVIHSNITLSSAKLHLFNFSFLVILFWFDTISTRSLRIVCNSWSLFVEFPRLEQGSGQLCPKRQKVVMECTDRKGVVSSSASLNVGRFSSVEEHNEGHAHGRNCSREYRLSFMAARDCLVSLRTSIDSLNRKKLFPYTPQVLLRRWVSVCYVIYLLILPFW